MTTIATDGRSVSGDGQITNDNRIESTSFVKVRHIGGGKRDITGIVAFSGDPSQFELFYSFLETDVKPDRLNMEKSEAIFVTPDGVYAYDENLIPIKVDLPFAMGSGGQIALGAMLAGKSPQQAVMIACKIDIWTGGVITTLTLTAQKGEL